MMAVVGFVGRHWFDHRVAALERATLQSHRKRSQPENCMAAVCQGSSKKATEEEVKQIEIFPFE
jgi:hypothetical protein